MHRKNCLSKFALSILLLLITCSLSAQTLIKGVAKDAKTQEALIGVAIAVKGTSKGAVTDVDGNFKLDVAPGKYTLVASYISYTTQEIADVVVKKGEGTNLDILLQENAQALKELTVVGLAKISSEVSILNSMKSSTAVMSGISSQQISKNQDRDAAEVIKRIPGIAIMDNKFIIVRGLAQRYNNVWLNNSATPSSEADARSFSFDILPSSQIENILIVKSPQPELPADFTGGFVKVATKGIPSENSIELSYTTGMNTESTFKDLKYNPGSNADIIGFGSGSREIKSWVPSRLDEYNSDQINNVSQNGFNNDWSIKTKKAIPDQRLTFALNRRIQLSDTKQLGIASALNYSNVYRTYKNMQNTQYAVYDNINDKPFADYDYRDDQYNNNVRLGAMANLTLVLNANNRLEFRNMFNQLAQDRYTYRTGTNYSNGTPKIQEKQEYLYATRSVYSGQLGGKHTLKEGQTLDWSGGFSYSNKNQPDRRMIDREQNKSTSDDPNDGLMYISSGDIQRNFVKLDEYIYSGTLNYTHDLQLGNLTPTIKTGLYGEYKTREYNTRDFAYVVNPNNLEKDFVYKDLNEILQPQNYGTGTNKMPIREETSNIDSYKGKNSLMAGYLGVNLPVEKFNIYGGLRYEYNLMTLTNYVSEINFKTKDSEYETSDIFPSLNVSYELDNKNIVRFGYGMSINRPEFREVSPSSYYDFDLFNLIVGNSELKSAYIHNFDIRYELYPSSSELISLALFYKNFKNPIEWTFINTGGGGRNYTFENALSANNFGVEIDIKKNFDFIGFKDFSLVLNGSIIDSKVKFPATSIETERALQGQSPFLVNTGLFYQNEDAQLTVGLMYNIVGKRIVGIGLKAKNDGAIVDQDIPDMYEMPRNVFDLTINKGFGKNFELSAGIKDILAQDIVYKQFPKITDASGKIQDREQTTKLYKPGRNITISGKLKF